MKKILFLQIKGKSFGGIWHVNKTIGEELIKNGNEVHIVSLRENQNDILLEHIPDLIVKTLNKKERWESYHLIDIKNDLKRFKILEALKKFLQILKYKSGLKKDVKKLHKYIFDYNPDFIITTHYQLLSMIPKSYLNKTFHEQHSSLIDALRNKKNRKAFDKYNKKVKIIWLSKQTMENAIKLGYKNSTFIYNAVRFKSELRANVSKNKKLITIARLSEDKSVDIMISIVNEIFKDSKYKDWKLEIYGEGDKKEELNKLIQNKKQIKLMGLTNKPKEKLLSASINLNTSKYEGFSLSILEANECGVPTVSFDFGESCREQIIAEETGIVAKNKQEYILKLRELMDDSAKLERISKNAKKHSQNFQIENIIQKWLNLFNK